MKLKHIFEKSNAYDLARLQQERGEIKRELRDARASGDDDDIIADLEQQLQDINDQIELAHQSRHPLRESNEDLAPMVDALSKRISRFILANAQHDWQQNKNRYISRDGYTDFADWFNVDYLGNSYNIDSVIDNIGASIKQRVVASLQGPQRETE